jgi:hypothetical protein
MMQNKSHNKKAAVAYKSVENLATLQLSENGR